MNVQDLERGVDRLLSRSVGTSLRGKVSEVAARLSNEILSIRGLSEKEIAGRVSTVARDLVSLERQAPMPGHLMGDFHQALLLYPELVERYQASKAPASLGERLLALGNEVAFLDKIGERDLGGPRGALLRNWVSGVFLADEALKRHSARTFGEKVDMTPSSEDLGRVNWNTATAVAGALAMGGLLAFGGD